MSENESFSLPSLEHDDVALSKTHDEEASATAAASPSPSLPVKQEEQQQQQSQQENKTTNAAMPSTSPQPLVLRELTNTTKMILADQDKSDKVESVIKRIEMEVGKMEGEEDDDVLMEVDEVDKTEEDSEDMMMVDAGCDSGVLVASQSDTLDMADNNIVETACPQGSRQEEVGQTTHVTDETENETQVAKDDSSSCVEMVSAPIMYEARASSTHFVKQLAEVQHEEEDKVDGQIKDSVDVNAEVPKVEEKEEEVVLRPKKETPVPKPRSIISDSSHDRKSLSLPPTTTTNSVGEKRLTFAVGGDSTSPKRAKSSLNDDDRIGARQLRGCLKLSSTTSLHIQPDGDHQVHQGGSSANEEEQPLQRRNSIHNVPFVDVNDPDTRERMERYKEERRSMLRAKYKVEDYVTKKEEDVAAPAAAVVVANEEVKVVVAKDNSHNNKEESVSPKPAARTSTTVKKSNQPQQQSNNVKKPQQQQQQQQQKSVPLRRMPVESPAVRKWSAPARKAATPSPEASKRKSMQPPVRKTSEPPSPRPRSTVMATSPRTTRKQNSSRGGSEEKEEVNVRQRAAIFGGGGGAKEVSKAKVNSNLRGSGVNTNTSSNNNNARKRSPVTRATPPPSSIKVRGSSGNNKTNNKTAAPSAAAAAVAAENAPTSPSKIKNMAAIFEQRQN